MPETITMTKNGLKVGNNPIIPFIEGDGTGPDIWRATVRVVATPLKRRIQASARSPGRGLGWRKAFNTTGKWLPQETLGLQAVPVGIKGVTTPIGGESKPERRDPPGMRPVRLPQAVRWFEGVPSPVLHREG